MIDAQQLASMQAQMADTRGGSIVIYRRTRASDGQGGQTYTWGPVTGGTVAYRVLHLSGFEREMAARLGSANTYQIGLPLTPEVLPRDQLRDGTVPVYEVTAANLPRTYPLEQVVECVRL